MGVKPETVSPFGHQIDNHEDYSFFRPASFSNCMFLGQFRDK